MARVCVCALVAALVALLAPRTHALLKEHAGTIDWKQSYVGSIAHSFVGAETTVVATTEGVLASLSNADGSIVWRKEMRPGETIQHLFQADDDVVTVSGDGIARRFETEHGTLVWEAVLQSTQLNDIPPSQLPAVQSPASFAVAMKLRGKNALAAATDDKLHLIRLSDGSSMWSTDLEIGNYVLGRDETHVFAVGSAAAGSNTKVMVAAFAIEDGTAAARASAELTGAQTCKASWNAVVCSSAETGVASSLVLTPDASSLSFTKVDSSDKVTSVAKICSSFPVLALSSDQGTRYIRFGGSSVSLAAVGPGESCTIELHPVTEDGILICSSIKGDSLQVNYFNIETGKKLEEVTKLSNPSGFSTSFVYDVFFRFQGKSLKNPTVMVRLQDDTVHFWSGEGLSWSREEALASIVAVEFAELPAQTIDESAFSSKTSPIVHFVTRLKSSVQSLVSLLSSARTAFSSPKDTLQRDLFNQHKLILTLSSSGKLIALKSWNGEIVWTRNMLHGKRLDRAQLFTLRSAANPNPIAFAFAHVAGSDETVGFAFHPISGAETNISVPKNIKLVSQLPAVGEGHTKPVLLVDSELKSHIFPNDKDIRASVQAVTIPIHLFSVDVAANVIQGYRVLPTQDFSVEPTWTISFDPSVEKIAAVANKPQNERVNALGEPLGDRSVLYKYLNPNMLALATLSDYDRRAAVLSVYIIDTVKGSFIDKITEENVRGPVHLAQSEHWVVYHVKNKKSRQYELGVIELYDGGSKAPESGFSSFDSAKPIVLRQSFAFPSAVTTMAATHTEQGITNKQVLLGLVSGGILALPKRMVDARRPTTKKASEIAVGLVPYHPYIGTDARALLNYYQGAFRLKSIQVSPTNLESTSLVFANGLDLFFTHVNPSRKFDALNDDFNHPVLLGALAALIIASYVLGKLFAQKKLKEMWK